jgi:hypothetical protein
MRLGQPLSARGANEGPERGDAESRYACLLDTVRPNPNLNPNPNPNPNPYPYPYQVRRERTYAALHRPSHDKSLGSGSARLSNDKASARRPEAIRPRASIFDPDKKLEIEGGPQHSNPDPGPTLNP